MGETGQVYSLASASFWLAAPEGFSAAFPRLAHTTPRLAVCFGRLLVSIVAFMVTEKVSILYHRTKCLSSISSRKFVVQVHEIGNVQLLY